MPDIQHANGPLPQAANTTLTASIAASGAVSPTVASATYLPSVGPFLIVVDNERIMVDSISGTTLTILSGGRGQEGTTAAAHASGAEVFQVFSVGTLRRHIDERTGGSSTGPRVGCRLRRVAAQSVNPSTATDVIWDQEDQDTDGFWPGSGATITVPSGFDGIYAISFVITGPVTGTNRAFNDLTVTSGITGTPSSFRAFIAAAEDRDHVSITIPLAAGDTVKGTVFHAEATAINYTTGYISMYRVGL